MKKIIIMTFMSLISTNIFVLPCLGEDVIYGCYHKNNGQLRIVKNQIQCGPSEVFIQWNQAGPAGPQGAQGPKGDKGDKGDQGPPGDPGPLANVGEIIGKVQCSTTGTPLGSVLVYIAGESFSSVTDQNGNFALSYVPAGPYRLNISWPLVEAQIQDVQVQGSKTLDLGTISVVCGGCEGKPDATPCDPGNPCSINNQCVNGVCVGTLICCPQGQKLCGNTCVDTASDRLNCGDCEIVCQSVPNAITTCSNGSCLIGPCIPGYANCNNNLNDGCEVNLMTDVNNCRSCGTKCSFPNAIAACSNGNCFIGSCNLNYANCNNNPDDGCEVNLMTDANNCRLCGTKCSFPNATATCSNGYCLIDSCNLGYANCNNNNYDGCEVNLKTDVNNCGTCLSRCSFANATAACSNGSCAIGSCNLGYANCNNTSYDGCEVNLLNDSDNCGSCGNKCGFLYHCDKGECKIL